VPCRRVAYPPESSLLEVHYVVHDRQATDTPLADNRVVAGVALCQPTTRAGTAGEELTIQSDEPVWGRQRVKIQASQVL
jgi:hypothetical protein